MDDPYESLRRRVDDLELELQRLHRELSDERARSTRRNRRERWLRIAFWIAVGLAYALYLQRVSSVL